MCVCWDNAQQESFWASLKVEFFYRVRGPPEPKPWPPSPIGLSGSITAAEGTPCWECSPQYSSNSSNVRRQKPLDQLSTYRGQPSGGETPARDTVASCRVWITSMMSSYTLVTAGRLA